jgi:hypothetical protein
VGPQEEVRGVTGGREVDQEFGDGFAHHCSLSFQWVGSAPRSSSAATCACATGRTG